eukprot:TRINITY_DN6365_c0_g1_i10.p1 TRINITY_DN6365_c0_g1~~TRINITY_DN6365_c0_g1_i10.p1  ORF type:complete len:464 (+),score=58.39 TRINITY_DN6365_c0_g1_i10:151-1542(+)
MKIAHASLFATFIILLSLIQSSTSLTAPLKDPLRKSGYFPVSNSSFSTESSIFYLFYHARKIKSSLITKTPIIIWLNGGPGATSLLGAFLSHGPYRIVADANGAPKEELRPQSWADEYNILFLDQPISAGYSFAAKDEDIPTSTPEAAAHIYNFLQNFYKSYQFNMFAKVPLYIFGESYAGKYIPCFAEYILKRNAERRPGSIEIPLRGVGIGNGLIDPFNQLSKVGSFGYHAGLIDDSVRDTIEGITAQATLAMQKGDTLAAEKLMFNDVGVQIIESSGRSLIDFRKEGPSNKDLFNGYLNSAEVMDIYGVNRERVKKFVKTNLVINQRFKHEVMVSFKDKLEFVVNQIPVIILAGQNDVATNFPGQAELVATMKWRDAKNFSKAKFTPYVYKGKNVGMVKSYGNLWFTVINKSGHGLFGDQLEVCLHLINNFIHGKKEWRSQEEHLQMSLRENYETIYKLE